MGRRSSSRATARRWTAIRRGSGSTSETTSMTWPIGGVGRRNSAGWPSNTIGRRPVRGCQAHPIRTWPDSAGREALNVDGPPEFERLVARLQGRGLHAQFRRWAEGDTVFVGAGPERLPGVEFVGFRRAIYIG